MENRTVIQNLESAIADTEARIAKKKELAAIIGRHSTQSRESPTVLAGEMENRDSRGPERSRTPIAEHSGQLVHGLR